VPCRTHCVTRRDERRVGRRDHRVHLHELDAPHRVFLAEHRALVVQRQVERNGRVDDERQPVAIERLGAALARLNAAGIPRGGGRAETLDRGHREHVRQPHQRTVRRRGPHGVVVQARVGERDAREHGRRAALHQDLLARLARFRARPGRHARHGGHRSPCVRRKRGAEPHRVGRVHARKRALQLIHRRWAHGADRHRLGERGIRIAEDRAAHGGPRKARIHRNERDGPPRRDDGRRRRIGRSFGAGPAQPVRKRRAHRAA
jgi:hypothetical protein